MDSIVVQPASSNLPLGSSLPLQVTVRDADGNSLSGKTIFFTTDAPSIVSVSGSGVVTGLTTGRAQVAASSEGHSAIAVITVVPPPVATVTVLPANAQIDVGATVQLNAATYDAGGTQLSGRQVLWSTSDASIATVSSSGLVTGRAPGAVSVTATSEGKSGTAQVQVKAIPVASVAIAPSSATLIVGGQVQLTAQAFDASGNVLAGRSISWQSDRSDVASVSPNGLVTAAKAGSAVITASAEGKSGTASITVVPPTPVVTQVKISPQNWNTQPLRLRQFTAKAYDQFGKEMQNVAFTWSSSDTQIVTVSTSGLAFSWRDGTAKIIVSAGAQSASADVTVR